MTKSVPWLSLTLLLTPSSNPASSVELSPNSPSVPTQDSNGRAQVWPGWRQLDLGPCVVVFLFYGGTLSG